MFNNKFGNMIKREIVFDKSIADLDPHDPNLSQEQKAKIMEECNSNAAYFFLHFVGKLSKD